MHLRSGPQPDYTQRAVQNSRARTRGVIAVRYDSVAGASIVVDDCDPQE